MYLAVVALFRQTCINIAYTVQRWISDLSVSKTGSSMNSDEEDISNQGDLDFDHDDDMDMAQTGVFDVAVPGEIKIHQIRNMQ